MSQQQVIPVSRRAGQEALIDDRQYRAMCRYALEQPAAFWAEQASRIDWMSPFGEVCDVSYQQQDLHIRWYADGQLNVSVNCLDRHLAGLGDSTAIIWESDDPQESHRLLSYRQLYEAVGRLANGLLQAGVARGDVVTIYLPLIPEAAIAMLACARIGAVHSVVFSGFSAESLAGRIEDCRSRTVITADHGLRAGVRIPLKDQVDAAIERCGKVDVERVVVVGRSGAPTGWQEHRDIRYEDLIAQQSTECEPAVMAAEDPLFILYTSGSTAKPKGLVHTSGGYLVYTSMTFACIFDYQPGDIYWCTADLGWITGHSYVLYGPLARGATLVMHEGVPHYPDIQRWSQIIEKYRVSIFYTAPCELRRLMGHGEAAVSGADLSSLRLLGSVGESIDPEVWRWFRHHFGRDHCPLLDTWWQTETGGIMIAPFPGATPLKPGAATRPFPGVAPILMGADGQPVSGEGEGNLVLGKSWPGQARTVFGDHEGFFQTYFSRYPGYFDTGDGARRDADGDYWITGRVDDVINVAGHRLGTAEIESALMAQGDVAEAAAVACPHATRGHGLYLFVAPARTADKPEARRSAELRECLQREIGSFAQPDAIQWVPRLPRTRSGKLMRRILRQIASDQCDRLGDLSTLAEPDVIQQLIDNRIRPPS